MYQEASKTNPVNTGGYLGTPAIERVATELETILNRFNEANARLDNLSLEIKNKVGQISTIMEEKSQDATNPKAPDVSITDRLHSALSSMSYYNDRLNTVLNHLNKII